MTNGKEIREKIIKDYGTLAVFAREYKIAYSYLSATINGTLYYEKVALAIKKAGYTVKEEVL
jgi:hypothetical protein